MLGAAAATLGRGWVLAPLAQAVVQLVGDAPPLVPLLQSPAPLVQAAAHSAPPASLATPLPNFASPDAAALSSLPPLGTSFPSPLAVFVAGAAPLLGAAEIFGRFAVLLLGFGVPAASLLAWLVLGVVRAVFLAVIALTVAWYVGPALVLAPLVVSPASLVLSPAPLVQTAAHPSPPASLATALPTPAFANTAAQPFPAAPALLVLSPPAFFAAAAPFLGSAAISVGAAALPAVPAVSLAVTARAARAPLVLRPRPPGKRCRDAGWMGECIVGCSPCVRKGRSV